MNRLNGLFDTQLFISIIRLSVFVKNKVPSEFLPMTLSFVYSFAQFAQFAVQILQFLQFTVPRQGTLLSHYRLFNALHDIAHVIVRYIRTGRQAEADLEEILLHAIGIDIVLCIYRLLVHWLP